MIEETITRFGVLDAQKRFIANQKKREFFLLEFYQTNNLQNPPSSPQQSNSHIFLGVSFSCMNLNTRSISSIRLKTFKLINKKKF
jgi:hypothetical protein